MMAIGNIRRTTIGAAVWEPCVTSGGRTIGEAEWLRRRTDGGGSHTSMLWRCEPMSFDYNIVGDESFLVLTGRVWIELKDGNETIELQEAEHRVVPEGDALRVDDPRADREVYGRLQLAHPTIDRGPGAHGYVRDHRTAEAELFLERGCGGSLLSKEARSGIEGVFHGSA
jgi:uncharacterized cupin superfamily protein